MMDPGPKGGRASKAYAGITSYPPGKVQNVTFDPVMIEGDRGPSRSRPPSKLTEEDSPEPIGYTPPPLVTAEPDDDSVPLTAKPLVDAEPRTWRPQPRPKPPREQPTPYAKVIGGTRDPGVEATSRPGAYAGVTTPPESPRVTHPPAPPTPPAAISTAGTPSTVSDPKLDALKKGAGIGAARNLDDFARQGFLELSDSNGVRIADHLLELKQWARASGDPLRGLGNFAPTNEGLINDIVEMLLNPETRVEMGSGTATCTPTAILYLLIVEKPADFVKIAVALLTRKAVALSRIPLRLDNGALANDDSSRTAPNRLFQASLMHTVVHGYVNDYTNSDPKDRKGRGLMQEEATRALELLFSHAVESGSWLGDPDRWTPSEPGMPAVQGDPHEAWMAKRLPLIVGVDWYIKEEKRFDGHALVVTEIKNGFAIVVDAGAVVASAGKIIGPNTLDLDPGLLRESVGGGKWKIRLSDLSQATRFWVSIAGAR